MRRRRMRKAHSARSRPMSREAANAATRRAETLNLGSRCRSSILLVREEYLILDYLLLLLYMVMENVGQGCRKLQDRVILPLISGV
jgi:hypothetical protein